MLNSFSYQNMEPEGVYTAVTMVTCLSTLLCNKVLKFICLRMKEQRASSPRREDVYDLNNLEDSNNSLSSSKSAYIHVLIEFH